MFHKSPLPNPDVEAVSFSHDSLGRGGGGDEGGGRGSCPGTPEMRRRQEEALKRLAGQVGSPCNLMYIYCLYICSFMLLDIRCITFQWKILSTLHFSESYSYCLSCQLKILDMRNVS